MNEYGDAYARLLEGVCEAMNILKEAQIEAEEILITKQTDDCTEKGTDKKQDTKKPS